MLGNRKPRELPESPQLKGGILRRSVILSLIIGSVLTLVNQFNALFGPDLIQILPLVLVYVTPFMVIAVSQLAAIRQAGFDAKGERVPGKEENLFATALSHGIPARAVTIGLIMGAINLAIILTASFLRTGDIGTTPIALLGQVYALPVLFGFLSQAVAYRQAAKLNWKGNTKHVQKDRAPVYRGDRGAESKKGGGRLEHTQSRAGGNGLFRKLSVAEPR